MGLQTHSNRLSHVTGMFLPPGLSSTSLSSRDKAVKFSITMSEKMARVTPAAWLERYKLCLSSCSCRCQCRRARYATQGSAQP